MTHKIDWSSKDTEGKIAIYLQKWQPDLSGVEEILIADNIPITEKEYQWRIPENQKPSSFLQNKNCEDGRRIF